MKLQPILNEIKKYRINEIHNSEEIEIDSRDYHPESKSFSFEVSDKDCRGGLPWVILRNSKTGKSMQFKLYKVDKDASDEDTYGWRYKSHPDGKYSLLIIND